MDQTILTAARDHLEASIAAMHAAHRDESFIKAMHDAALMIVATLRNGGKVLVAGNGGSAADAQHIAGEFLSRLNFDRTPLPAIALTTDTSVLTAVGNDYGYEHVFERQVRGLGNPGDVFIGISTSGRSPNVVLALEAAREKGLLTIGFCGKDPRSMGPLCDIAVCAPSGETPIIQQIHIVAAHIICGEVERILFAPEAAARQEPQVTAAQ
jgi:D-sedoheptulose 7-phosphate isomerase